MSTTENACKDIKGLNWLWKSVKTCPKLWSQSLALAISFLYTDASSVWLRNKFGKEGKYINALTVFNLLFSNCLYYQIKGVEQ